jgi:hypothetical protein
MRFVIEDGLAHAVDSSELAFKTAAIGAIRECNYYLFIFSLSKSKTHCLGTDYECDSVLSE